MSCVCEGKSVIIHTYVSVNYTDTLNACRCSSEGFNFDQTVLFDFCQIYMAALLCICTIEEQWSKFCGLKIYKRSKYIESFLVQNGYRMCLEKTIVKYKREVKCHHPLIMI